MIRRAFLKLLAALPFAPALLARPEAEGGHLFEWSSCRGGPSTTDPRWRGKLRHGKHNRVLVDGVDAGAAIRFKTGPDGWVERFAKGPDGTFVHRLYDRWNGDRLAAEGRRGGWAAAAPEYEGARFLWQLKSPDRVGADGELVPRWREEIVVEVLRGNVVYAPRET
jgi:hypothetical protein